MLNISGTVVSEVHGCLLEIRVEVLNNYLSYLISYL